MTVTPPAELLARLERALPVLTGGARDLPERQRGLRAKLTWSHDLLAPAERALNRRLAAFAGGGTLEAVEAVCAAVGPPADDPAGDGDVLGGLATLADQSLVRVAAPPSAGAGEARWGMLETVREDAAERLAASGEEGAVRRALPAVALTPALSQREREGLSMPRL